MIWSTRVLAATADDADRRRSRRTLTAAPAGPCTKWAATPTSSTPRGAAAQGRLERRLGLGPPALERPRHEGASRDRLQVRAEGLQAELQARQRTALGNGVDIDIRPMEAEPAAPRLRRAAREREDRFVRAAPARARHADVPRSDLGLQHPDAELRRLRPQLGARLRLRRRLRAAPAEGHDPAHHRLHGQLAVQQERSGSAQLAGLGQPLGREHVHRPRPARLADRRAVPGGDGEASRAAAPDQERRGHRLPAVPHHAAFGSRRPPSSSNNSNSSSTASTGPGEMLSRAGFFPGFIR